MKIAVYAICKNEEQFVERWVKSMSEADGIFVSDTGSTDSTVKLLKEQGVNVSSIDVKPWRFDTARNMSLEFVPKDYDICVCTDLDEVFDKGWRNELEKAWQDDTTRLSYNYIWSFKDNGEIGTSFWIEKIHTRDNFRWIHPVHEVLEYTGNAPDKHARCSGITLKHFPDKTKSRGQYLPLLELSVMEAPNDDRNMHYLGREYMYYKKWDECIETLKKHLKMPSATWKDERCASMRYIAKSYRALGDFGNAKKWLYRAIAEAPYLREGYIDLALLAYSKKEWETVLAMVKEALKISNRPKTYINEGYCWDSTPYDIASIAAYNLGIYNKALEYAQNAYNLNPCDRIKNNIKLIEKRVE